MTKTTTSLLLAGVAVLALPLAPAQAQSSRTYVSAAIGDDNNDCSRPAPCRTFQGAHDKTNPDGEVTVLDPGGYGALTITKSISIVNDGVGEASILVSGGKTGITVNAGPASYINLRGITIQGIGFGGGMGLRFNSGFSLTMTKCVVRNHNNDAIHFEPTSSSRLAISDTLVADNAQGIFVSPASQGSPSVNAVFRRIGVYNSHLQGVAVNGPVTAVVADSVASGNHAAGFLVSGGASLTVTRSVTANNGDGLFASGANSLLRFGRTTVTGNYATTWTEEKGGAVRSYGTNNINGNADGDPPPSTIATK